MSPVPAGTRPARVPHGQVIPGRGGSPHHPNPLQKKENPVGKEKIEHANGHDLGAEEIITPATPPTPPEDTGGSEDDNGNGS